MAMAEPEPEAIAWLAEDLFLKEDNECSRAALAPQAAYRRAAENAHQFIPEHALASSSRTSNWGGRADEAAKRGSSESEFQAKVASPGGAGSGLQRTASTAPWRVPRSRASRQKGGPSSTTVWRLSHHDKSTSPQLDKGKCRMSDEPVETLSQSPSPPVNS